MASLTADVRNKLLARATEMIGKYKYDSRGIRLPSGLPDSEDDVMDCSEFVFAVYSKAGVEGVPYLNSHGIAGSSLYEEVAEPQAGDIVYWRRGHVAIVEDPVSGAFIGSQTSTGVARSNYKTNIYWKNVEHRKFYRWRGP